MMVKSRLVDVRICGCCSMVRAVRHKVKIRIKISTGEKARGLGIKLENG